MTTPTGRDDIRAVMGELRRLDRPYKRVVIAGGGNIGLDLARKLERHYAVKIIESHQHRARYLAENLDRTIVVRGSASDRRGVMLANRGSPGMEVAELPIGEGCNACGCAPT